MKKRGEEFTANAEALGSDRVCFILKTETSVWLECVSQQKPSV